MNFIAVIILAALLVFQVLHITADVFNLRHMATQLPEAFKGWFDPERYRQSQLYLQVNTRFDWVVSIAGLVVFLGFWFGHGFYYLDVWVRQVFDSAILRGLLYIGVLVVAGGVIMLPFSIYQTFWIEDRFGFNRTDVKTFVLDLIKQVCLGAVIGGVLLAAVLWFFIHAGENAWLYCWLVVVGFMGVMQFIFPAWILPLFNKFSPLEEGELRSAILSYAESIGFPLKNVFVMDGSKRSSKSNAFFAGFGRHKRIVLFDTLIENHDVDELVGVLAHEMGHYKKKHVHLMMLAGIVEAGIMFYLLSFFISAQPLFEAFFMEQTPVYAGLLFFGILYSPIEFFLGLLMKVFSRRNEYAADRFAADTTGRPNAFIRALKRLSVNNLSNLQPHPLYVVLNYSHPPVMERIRAISD